MAGDRTDPQPPRKAADARATAPGGETIDIAPEEAAKAAAENRAPSHKANAIYLDSAADQPRPDTPAAKPSLPVAESSATVAPGPGPGGIHRCGEYELIEEIGRGGMGRVYLARSQKLNRLVALKMLLAGPGAGLDQIRRLMVEAKTMAALEHPNVVRIFDTGVEGDIHYFTMEYIDGPSLSEVMHRLKVGGGSSSNLPDLIETLRKRKGSSSHATDSRGAAGKPASKTGSRTDRAEAPGGNLPPAPAAITAPGDPAPPPAATEELRRAAAAQPGGKPPPTARRDLPDRAGHPPMPVFQAAVLMEKCARALAHAHARGIIHRDLKPGNILMRAADDPVLLDFGLARQVNLEDEAAGGEGESPRLTMMGQVLGTPAYMSPEQARGEIDLVDELSDTYALGAILYEMLTGREPLSPSRTIGEALRKIQEEEPVPPSKWAKRIPSDLETITLKCLQKERSQRYPNAEAFAEDLRRLREGEPILARPQGWLYRTYKFVEKHRLPLTAAGVVTVFFLLLLGTVLWQAYRQEVESSATNARQLAQLREERVKKQQAESELENLLGQLNVNEFNTHFERVAEMGGEEYPFHAGVWPAKSAEGKPLLAGYWRVLRGRLNGRSGAKHSLAEFDNGLLFFNAPLIGDVTIEYEIAVQTLTPEITPEIAFVLNARDNATTDSGYFVSVKAEGVRVRRLGAEVHGSPGYAALTPGERYRVRIAKVSDRLTVDIKPARQQDQDAGFTTVVDFRDTDPISGEQLNRFGWYLYRSEAQIFSFRVTRPVPARPRPIHFAHKLFNRGEYEMARAEYQEVSRIGLRIQTSASARAALSWIRDDGVEADYRIALCNERLADRETDPARIHEKLAAAETAYLNFLYRDPEAQTKSVEEYPELRALTFAHLAICYLKRGWFTQADGIVEQLAAFGSAPGPDLPARRAAADSGWSLLAEFAQYESVRIAVLSPATAVERSAQAAKALAWLEKAADFARRLEAPRLAEEKAKSLLQSLRMSYRLDRNSPEYIASIAKVYASLGQCKFRSAELFMHQLAFHEEDLAPTLYDALMRLARERQAPEGDLEAFRVVRLCGQESTTGAEAITALEKVYALTISDLPSLLRCGEKARDYQNFELAHKFFERALRHSAADNRRMAVIYRGLGSAMYDIGENAVDPAQRVRGMADLLAAADYAGDADLLDEEAERVERFLEQRPEDHPRLKEYLQNTAAPAFAARRWGLFCLCAGRFDEARASLQKAFQEEPQNPFTLYLLAVATSHAGETDLTAEYLQKAADRWPSTLVLDSLSALQLSLDHDSALFKVCELANDQRPFNETANGRRAFALARLQRWPDAVQAAQLTLDLDRTSRPALIVAMAAALRNNNLDLAHSLERQLADLPDFSQLRLDSKIRQNTRLKLPRAIGFTQVALGNVEDLLPLGIQPPTATP